MQMIVDPVLIQFHVRNLLFSFIYSSSKNQERKDSTRFAKGQSETFSTLEGLVAKGVKVGSNYLKAKLIV